MIQHSIKNGKNYSNFLRDSPKNLENPFLGKSFLKLHVQLVFKAAHLACCDDFALALPDGYDTVLSENSSSLSGGERQRISIALAILKGTSIHYLSMEILTIFFGTLRLLQTRPVWTRRTRAASRPPSQASSRDGRCLWSHTA